MPIREQFKSLLSNIIGLDPGFIKLYYRYFYTPKPNSLAEQLDQHARGKKPFYFFQIGGNDGFINDPMFRFVKRYGWRGIIVEPQQDVFENRLSRTYRFNSNIKLENVAIASETGTRKLYKLAISNSRWATGLASFNREALVRQIGEGRVIAKARKENVSLPNTPENWITYEEVKCSTVEHLLEKHDIPKLDLLQIDTEGFDYEIIKMIDFTKVKPAILCFEHIHLDEESRAACHELLSKQGYSLAHYGSDTMAVQPT